MIKAMIVDAIYSGYDVCGNVLWIIDDDGICAFENGQFSLDLGEFYYWFISEHHINLNSGYYVFPDSILDNPNIIWVNKPKVKTGVYYYDFTEDERRNYILSGYYEGNY